MSAHTPEKWPTSAETSPVAWPIDVMDGAEWNILDATGTRIAVCGFDQEISTGRFRHESGRIANAIVGMIRNLKIKADATDEAIAELAALREENTKLHADNRTLAEEVERLRTKIRRWSTADLRVSDAEAKTYIGKGILCLMGDIRNTKLEATDAARSLDFAKGLK